MDLARTGVVGWSFGGYFAAMATMRRPTCSRPASRERRSSTGEDYDTYYTERYLQHPAENAKGYRASNVLTYADRTGAAATHHPRRDGRQRVFPHSLKLVDALLKAGKPYELLLLPGTHMLADPAIRRSESERIMAFLANHLGGAK